MGTMVVRVRAGMVFGVLALVLTAGCGDNGRYGLTMNDVGSTQLAVLSVTSWEDYRSELKPTFELTSNAALDLATPDTRLFESAVLDAFRSKLNVRLAPSQVLLPGFGTPTAPAGSAAGTPPSEPGVTAAGSTTGVTVPSLDGAGSKLSEPPAFGDPKSLGGDAFLKYLAATAIFQEVKLLERYVQDAAQKDGYQAFIVRLQLSNQPYSDRHGYDTYANVAFFNSPIGTDPAVPSTVSMIVGLAQRGEGLRKMSNWEHFSAPDSDAQATLNGVVRKLNELQRSSASVATSITEVLSKAKAARGELDKLKSQWDAETKPNNITDDMWTVARESQHKVLNDVRDALCDLIKKYEAPGVDVRLPVVIPLLVTDQVEAALISGRTEELRQLAFGLSAAFAGIGADVNLEKIDQAIEKASGRSYRSLFTVGRLSDNMLRVRMAARAVPDSAKKGEGFDYETLARTHNVSVLVLVPRDVANASRTQTVHVATRYEYRWPDDGKRIGTDPAVQGSGADVATSALTLINNGGYGKLQNDLGAITPFDALHLAKLAQGNDYKKFDEKFKEFKGSSEEANRLYMDLNVAKVGSNFDSTQFEVQIKTEIQPSLGEGNAYAIDDGEHVEITLDGVEGLDPLKVSGSWKFVPSDGRPLIILAATGAELKGRNQLVVKFPSLLKLEIIERGQALKDTGDLYLSHEKPFMMGKKVESFIAQGTPPAANKLTFYPSDKLNLSLAADKNTASITLGYSLKSSPNASGDGSSLAKDKLAYVLQFSTPSVTVAQVHGANGALTDNETIAEVKDRPGTFVIKGSGTASFEFANLVAGNKIDLVITPPNDGAAVKPLEISVNKAGGP